MELLIHMVLMPLTIAAAVYLAIKYDEYEPYISDYLDYKVTPLVYDPVDGEWEFVRKVRFEYIETTVAKYEEESTGDFGYHPYSGIDFQRCA